MRLYLVRHPLPVVDSGVCYGSTDVEVAPQELDRLVCRLAKAIPLAVSLPEGAAIYSSPLRRCADLARRLALKLGCAAPVFDGRLAEMHFGDWELRNWDDIPRCEVDAWAGDLTMYRPGNGESVLQVAERVRAFYVDMLLAQRNAVVVCHAGTIRMLSACRNYGSLHEVALHAASTPMKIAYGKVIVMDCPSVFRRSD